MKNVHETIKHLLDFGEIWSMKNMCRVDENDNDFEPGAQHRWLLYKKLPELLYLVKESFPKWRVVLGTNGLILNLK